ncbi:Protein of unknown function (DUF2935) [Desulfosporosinus orientis DSM 765]|uniref:DUF2935 domain-containing protein n=1 Tax=Desulfosporosinus orientis (strain ATCC 19365 / DSM 765 / NCIMB 8382 / VKM B-1628 / Singapore I) TaxID=768706 RepID=G7W7B2_DESOD|nr:DUF2935 domain-containing protein [Desulfosporosinus orientis]AET65783.1 Protein of unknown function (DUF2935) [Desulfosporosinus orientis DSM 765]
MLDTANVPMIGDFVRESLDLHLFFARIMKEHAIFMQTGFLPKDLTYAQQAEQFRCQYDEIIKEAIMLGDCTASMDVLKSGELVTDKTLRAEQKTEMLTGIPIDVTITMEEANLKPDLGTIPPGIEPQVNLLNQKAMALTTDFAGFKEHVLEQVNQCCITTNLFPMQYQHLYKEAEFYLKVLTWIQNHQFVDARVNLLEQKLFWDEIMREHAGIIRHLLDPSEKELCFKAKELALRFEKLEKKLKGEGLPASSFEKLVRENIAASISIADYKSSSTELLLECQIKALSMLSPLLTDHTLREAYYYLRILQTWKIGYLGNG